MPDYTIESGGKSYTFSSDSPLSDSDLQAAAAQYFGPEQSTMGKIGNIISEEAGKLPGKIKSDLSGLAEGIMNPKMSTTLPLALGGPYGKAALGTASKVPGAITGFVDALRAGTPGALASATATGVGRAMDAPAGHKLEEGVKAGGLALAWNAALMGAPFAKVPYLSRSHSLADRAAPLAERQEAFASTAPRVMDAFKALKGDVPPGAWMNVPSISKTPITFEQASKGLSKLEGVNFDAARNEIFSELKNGAPGHAFMASPPMSPPVKAATALGSAPKVGPYAAEGFNTRVPEARFKPRPTDAEKFATGAIQGLQSPMARTAADIVAPEQGPGGVPIGAWPGILAKSALQHYAPRWLGGGR